MRKIISYALTVCIILSAFVLFPGVVSAETATNSNVILNNYDESNVSYQTNGEFTTNTYNGAYTTRTVNDTEIQLTDKSTIIDRITGIDGNETYAARFGPALNGTAYFTSYYSSDKLNVLKIYDSNNENLELFTPKSNTTYSITLNYRSDVAPASDKPLRLMLLMAKDSKTFTYVADNVLVANIADISGTTSGWQTAKAVFTTGDTVTPLYIAMISNSTWYSSTADVWVDNVKLVEYVAIYDRIVTNFDGDQKTFFDDNNLDTSERFSFENIGTQEIPNYAAKYTRISAAGGNNGGWQSNYANGFIVYDSLGDYAAKFEKDTLYKLTFDVKRVVNNAAFHVGLVFDDSKINTNDFKNIKLDEYKTDGKIMELYNFSSAEADSDFATYTSYIKAPLSGCAAVVLYNDKADRNDSQEIYIDNFTVSPYEVSNNTVIDFEASQKTFYENNPITAKSIVDIVESEDSSHGTVMQFNKLKVYRADGYENSNTVLYPSMFALTDENGISTISYKEGDILNVSFQMKNNADIASSYFSEFTAALVFADSYNASTANVREYVQNGQTVMLKKIDAKANSDWVTYQAKVRVPCDGKAAFMLYGETWVADCNIYLDNLRVSIAVAPTETYIEFNEKQTEYYSNSENNVSYTASLISFDDVHGNAMKMTRIVACKDTNYRENEWVAAHPAAFNIVDTDGLDILKYEKGDLVSVSFQLKKTADISNEYFDKFSAALFFVDSTTEKLGWIADYADEYRIANIVDIDVSASDWVTYTANLTVPHSGYAVFAIYGTDWFVDTEVFVDNLRIEPYNPETLNRDGDINRDGKVDVFDLVRIKKMASQLVECTAYADINFDYVIAGADDIIILKKVLLGVAKIDEVATVAKGKTLVWNEEFNGNSLSNNFNFLQTMNTASDSLSYAVTYDSQANHKVEDGNLTLSVTKTDEGYSLCQGLTTANSMKFKYGYLEMNAKLPLQNGAWPSFWLLGNVEDPWRNHTLEWFSEFDIFESFGNSNIVSNVHRHGQNGASYGKEDSLDEKISASLRQISVNDNEFHKYGFEWSQEEVKFYFDDICYYSLKFSEYPESAEITDGLAGFYEPVYLVMNNEILTDQLNGTDPISQDYVIDYIRLYQNTDTDQFILN